MTDTIESLEAQLTALRRARASGTQSVSYGGKGSIEYRTDREMVAAISDLEMRLSELNGTGPVKSVYITSSKGT